MYKIVLRKISVSRKMTDFATNFTLFHSQKFPQNFVLKNWETIVKFCNFDRAIAQDGKCFLGYVKKVPKYAKNFPLFSTNFHQFWRFLSRFHKKKFVSRKNTKFCYSCETFSFVKMTTKQMQGTWGEVLVWKMKISS